jgi:hypothetical protein
MTSPANHRRGFSVNVFLPSGAPDGLKVVEKSNWTGRGVVIPRPMFAESRARPELDRTGVYLLVGPSDTSSLPALYVGDADKGQRIVCKDLHTAGRSTTPAIALTAAIGFQLVEVRLDGTGEPNHRISLSCRCSGPRFVGQAENNRRPCGRRKTSFHAWRMKQEKPADRGFAGAQARNTRHEADFRPPVFEQ